MTKKLIQNLSNTYPKTYWTILNYVVYSNKLPAIAPLDGNLVSDFCKKAKLFNNFFITICTPIHNANCLPSFTYRTGSKISLFPIFGAIFEESHIIHF